MIAIDYTVGNSLLVEWLPTKEGSKRQSQLIIYWTIGFILSYFAGTLIHGFGSHNWQVILASSVIPGIVTALFRSLAKLPASPSGLASQGKSRWAQMLIHKHIGKNWGLPKKLLKAKPANNHLSWKILFMKQYRRRTLVGGLFYDCQAFAFFGISIFSPILLENMGLGDSDLSGMIYNGSMLVGVLLGSWLFKTISRRAFLMGSFFISSLALILMLLGPADLFIFQIGFFAIFSVILLASLTLDYPYPTELFDLKVRQVSELVLRSAG